MMLKHSRLPILFVACCLAANVSLTAADAPATPGEAVSSTNAEVALQPGPSDGRIASIAARLLVVRHYSQHPLDDNYSEQFFDRYIDTLDGGHMNFIQADLDEFASYRTNLDDITVNKRGGGDVSPAFKIFARFLERLEQRTEYVDSLLKTEKFEFNTDEEMLLDRRDAPFPQNLDEAKKLWRQRLRYDYLQEKLALDIAKEQAEAKKKKASTTAETAKPSADKPGKTDDEEIAGKLSRRYNRNLHTFQEWDHSDVLEVYLTSLARVYDPHSDYMNPREADNFAIGMSLALFGIGAELSSEDGYCVIKKLHPGPAMKSKKIKEGDKIVAVAQGDGEPVDVVEMQLTKAVQLIRGPKGTEVRLTIIPADDPSERKVVSLIRDEIKLDSYAAKAEIIDFTNSPGKPLRLGVLRVPSFYATFEPSHNGDHPEPRSTTDDVTRLLDKLEAENVAGIILDLRRNGGGSLEEAIRLTGLFIKQGPIVQVFGPDLEAPLVDGDPDPKIEYAGPLIVLTDRLSASASEILAGALQDYGRALIVGDVSTHGKGTVQSVSDISRWPGTGDDAGILKITIRKFYRASGASTQLTGVLPDIVLPSVQNYLKFLGENSLDNPLKSDRIAPARYDRLNLVAPYLPELDRKTRERVATNQDYAYIREDIERIRKDQDEKTVSLNEKERLTEMEEAEARKEARDEERKSRADSGRTVYEITLADVDKPGLPTPVGQTNLTATANTDTNSVTVAVNASESDVDADEETAPAVDPMLDESERILSDYIALLQKDGMAIVKSESSKDDLSGTVHE